MLRSLAVIATLLVALLAGSTPANAITDGSLDNNGHPYVGLMVASDSTGAPMWRCSGTLLSATVYLTAGHCVESPAAHIELWFGADVQTNSNRWLDAAKTIENPDWNGYPLHGEVSGTPVVFDQWDPTRFFYRDLGIVVLDRPIVLAQYGLLPTANQFDTLKPSSKTRFTAVGYGLQKAFPDAASFMEQAAKVRMVANPFLVQINTPGFTGNFSLLLSNNAYSGGTCFGDSGGPNFYGSTRVIAGVTSYGLNPTCGGTGGVYRLDRSWNLDWLHEHFDLP